MRSFRRGGGAQLAPVRPSQRQKDGLVRQAGGQARGKGKARSSAARKRACRCSRLAGPSSAWSTGRPASCTRACAAQARPFPPPPRRRCRCRHRRHRCPAPGRPSASRAAPNCAARRRRSKGTPARSASCSSGRSPQPRPDRVARGAAHAPRVAPARGRTESGRSPSMARGVTPSAMRTPVCAQPRHVVHALGEGRRVMRHTRPGRSAWWRKRVVSSTAATIGPGLHVLVGHQPQQRPAAQEPPAARWHSPAPSARSAPRPWW
jgi:hypothetical protein